jgi:16S rRNA (cytosine967-C5)-methyltransferase
MGESAGIRPRRAALEILEQVRDGLPFEAALSVAIDQLTEPDRRLAHELAAGVLRQRSSLDAQLARLVNRDWTHVAAELQDILRLGAYQITTLERVPAHAAVDTSVELAKKSGGARAAGFVNAVLRRLSQTGPETLPVPQDPAERLASEYSHPLWLVRKWVKAFGQESAAALLQWNNLRPRLVAQPARQSLEDLAATWNRAGLEFETAAYGAGLIVNQTRPAELPGYRDGNFVIQDPAQALLVQFVNPPPEATVYDACAAPGGKSIALGRRAGRVISGDVSRLRVRRLRDNLRRAGSGREHVIVADARQPPLRPLDIVLLDAPCSGTGTIARHPDARWRITPRALKHIVDLQAELLHSAAAVVNPGGLLVYSTCSVEREENVGQVERFLAEHRDFQREPAREFPPELCSPQGDLVILPQLHGMDGAYGARLRRTG